MRTWVHTEFLFKFLVGGVGLLFAVQAASGTKAGASPTPSPASTSTAVATYARTYYSNAAASSSPTPVSYYRKATSPSPTPASTPAQVLTNVAPAPTPAATAAPTVELVISVPDQKLAVVVNGKVYRDYRISTSRYGEGDNWGSWRTPTGWLQIAGKIGGMAPAGAVFWRRQVTGEVLPANAPGRDPIVSRIIWLRGLEAGNRNAYQRCIYIHGTPQEAFLGRKASFGCIRMRSADVIQVFNWVNIGTPVAILEQPLGRAVKEADKMTLLAQNSPPPVRNEAAPSRNKPVQARNVPPPTIAAKSIAAKVSDYRIPAPIMQIERVGPPDPQALSARKTATAAD
jgi:lipoprotein-anchoring transpeptidase ErfK/SrfK